MTNLNDLSQQINESQIHNGFWEDDPEKLIPTKLALVHSEVSEAVEADRYQNEADLDQFLKELNEKDKISDEDYKSLFELYMKDSFEDELIDIIKKVLDIAGAFDIDIESHLKYKIRFDRLRKGGTHVKKY